MYTRSQQVWVGLLLLCITLVSAEMRASVHQQESLPFNFVTFAANNSTSNSTSSNGTTTSNVTCDCSGVCESVEESSVDIPVAISLQQLVDGLNTTTVIKFAQPPGLDREVMFIAQQTGQLVWVDVEAVLSENVTVYPDLSLNKTLVLDLSAEIVELNPFYDERGLIGLEFDPLFNQNGRFWVYYSSRTPVRAGSLNYTQWKACSSEGLSAGTTCGFLDFAEYDHVNKLVEYRWEITNSTANTSSTSNSTTNSSTSSTSSNVTTSVNITVVGTILTIEQPFFNHNGDNVLDVNPFDGWLYFGLGDGGCAYDPYENAQNPDVLSGKVIRINISALDVSGANSCDVPVVAFSQLQEACPHVINEIELYAWGIRNPSGFQFYRNPTSTENTTSNSSSSSSTTQDWDLIMTDVAENAYE
jgi:glucose/arabinose dehydrogenase